MCVMSQIPDIVDATRESGMFIVLVDGKMSMYIFAAVIKFEYFVNRARHTRRACIFTFHLSWVCVLGIRPFDAISRMQEYRGKCSLTGLLLEKLILEKKIEYELCFP